MQFLIYNDTGTPRVEVHSQGHPATESQGRIRTKISDFLFNGFYSHIHTLIHTFLHSFNNGITQVNLCQKPLGINHAKEGKSKHPLTDHLPITVPKEVPIMVSYLIFIAILSSIATPSLLVRTFILVESKYFDHKFNDLKIMRHGPCPGKVKT